MLNKKDIDYFVNELARQKSFWDRLGGKPNFKDKTILDFGLVMEPRVWILQKIILKKLLELI